MKEKKMEPNKTSSQPPSGEKQPVSRFLTMCPACKQRTVEITGILSRVCTNCGWSDMPPVT